jgi:beta-lactamase superfamily II metal-dependent hydrolase
MSAVELVPGMADLDLLVITHSDGDHRRAVVA